MGSVESRCGGLPSSYVAPTIIVLFSEPSNNGGRAEALRLEAAVEALVKND